MAGGHDHDHGPESHGGTRAPVSWWALLDTVMIFSVIMLASLGLEMLIKEWKRRRLEGVRFDLTPKGMAATDAHNGAERPAPAAHGPEKTD